jgi:cyclic beta-1,2-glucan synthetase
MPLAWARLGEGKKAVDLLTMMNPVEHTRTPSDAARYCAEPYVVAADISDAPGRVGRAGWTWYTGSASWMYRVWIEEVLGFHLQGAELTINPVIPDDWPGFEITYRYGATLWQIVVARDNGPKRVKQDGAVVQTGTITLVDDQKPHRVDVSIPLAPEETRPGQSAFYGARVETIHIETAMAVNGRHVDEAQSTSAVSRLPYGG